MTSERLIEGLRRRYLGVLAGIACLLLLDQAVLQPWLVHLNLSAPAINLAGRQRMLSQRLAKSSLALAAEYGDREQQRDELRHSLEQWVQVHTELQQGSGGWKPSPRITDAFARLEPDFHAVRTSVETILADPEQSREAVQTLLTHESRYLEQMEQIVGLYEQAAKSQVQRLRMFSGLLAVTTLLLMAGLSVLILKPATTIIRDQLQKLLASEAQLREARDALEITVEQRTRELRDANTTLASEAETRRQTEERLRQLQSQLAQAARITSLGQLATGLAHELNQPLGAITNYSEALDLLADQPGTTPDELKYAARRLRDAALRAGKIVSGMRDFVRPSRGGQTRERIADLLREVLLLSEHQLRQEGIPVDCQFDESGADVVLVHRIQIQQVFLNLIQNALQAMREVPRSQRQLHIRSSRSHGQVSLEIEDRGPGFPSQRLPLQFQPFDSKKTDGLGMGLSICHALVTNHGGELTAENLSPSGARLTLTLPLADCSEHHVDSHSLCC